MHVGGGIADGGIEARSIRFSVSGGLDAGVATSKASDLFVVEDVVENNGGPEGTSYSGVISARAALPEECSKARVSVLLRDGSGALTAGYSTVIEVDRVAERSPFEISAPGIPRHSSYEVSVSPWD